HTRCLSDWSSDVCSSDLRILETPPRMAALPGASFVTKAVVPNSIRPMAAHTIASIDALPLVYPTVGRFKFFEGPKGRPSGRAAEIGRASCRESVEGGGGS